MFDHPTVPHIDETELQQPDGSREFGTADFIEQPADTERFPNADRRRENIVRHLQ